LEGFNNKLPLDLSIKWSKRLLTTAGITIMKLTKEGYKETRIELSIKVVDNEERLRNTLLHEMCHAAAFYIDGERKPPHGNCYIHFFII
jgi:predicted SprT family Zn-dependent metalloprotease